MATSLDALLLRWNRYVAGAFVTAVALTLTARAASHPAVPEVQRKSAATPLPEGAIARIGSPRLRHAGEVAAMAFSTDGRWLASASPDEHDRSVRVWDLADGAEKLRVPIEVSAKERVAVGFSKDGRHLRVIDFTSYRVIDRATGRQVLRHRFYEKAPSDWMDPSLVVGAAFSPDLITYAIVRRNGELILGDAATGKVRRTIPQGVLTHQNRSWPDVRVLFSGDNRRVCVPIRGHPMKIFDSATGKVINTLTLKPYALWASAFLKGGDEYAYFAEDGAKEVVKVVNFADAKIVRRIPVEKSAYCLAASPDGKLLAVGNTARFCVQLLDPTTGKEICRIPCSFSARRLAFSPDSTLLAGVSDDSGSITVWETASGKRLPSSADGIVSLHGFDRDGRLVVGDDRRYHITDWKTGRVLSELPVFHGLYNSVAYSPDHRLKAYHDMVKTENSKPEKGFPITVRDVATDKEISRLIGNTEYCPKMVFTNDSKRLITVSRDGKIRLWHVADGEELWAEKQGLNGAGAPHLSADDRRLAIVCVRSDREIELRVYDLAKKKRIAVIPVPLHCLEGFGFGISFSPDGKFLAWGGTGPVYDSHDKGAVFVWDVDAGKVCRKLAGRSGEISCPFAPDGRTLATVDPTGLIRIWELSTGQERFRITGHRGRTRAHFSPDSALIAGWSNDAPILIWDIYRLSHSAEPFDTEKAWQALKDGNATRAFTAMRRLCAAPEQTVKLLREKLKPVEKIEAETVRKWIRELDDDEFAIRETAQKSLAKLGERAADYLRAALQRSHSAEAKARLNLLLAALDVPLTADQLRCLRAIEVLERIGSVEAKTLLADVAQGAAGARLTKEAKASLARWRQR